MGCQSFGQVLIFCNDQVIHVAFSVDASVFPDRSIFFLEQLNAPLKKLKREGVNYCALPA